MTNASSQSYNPKQGSTASADYKLLLCLFVFLILFFALTPFWVYIADEVSYIEQAFSFIGAGSNNLNTGELFKHVEVDYPLGTSSLLAPFVYFFSTTGLYIANVSFLVISFFAIRKSIGLLNSSRTGLTSYLFCCIPILFFTRTVMSEIPSMLIISIAYLIYFAGFFKKENIFLFSALATSSIWFRETNILIFLIPIAHLIYKQPKQIGLVLGGLALGFIPRLFFSWKIYGDMFYVKDPGYGFALSNIGENLPIYAIIFLILFPCLLYSILHFKTSRQRILNGSIVLYTVVYLLYGYNGMEASGLKAILLSSRFMIPILPVAILSFSLIQKQWITRLASILPFLAICIMLAFYAITYFAEKPMRAFKDKLNEIVSNEATVLIDYKSAESIEIVTPFIMNGKITLSDISNFDNSSQNSGKVFYFIHQRRSDNIRRQEEQEMLDETMSQFIKSPHELVLKEETPYQQLEIYKLSSPDE